MGVMCGYCGNWVWVVYVWLDAWILWVWCGLGCDSISYSSEDLCCRIIVHTHITTAVSSLTEALVHMWWWGHVDQGLGKGSDIDVGVGDDCGAQVFTTVGGMAMIVKHKSSELREE